MALFLENVVANALQEILGQYFDGFEKQRLKLSVLSGDLALKKLRVRKDALDTFLLPFKVKWGEVGEFKLKVPWKRLVKEPVVITLDSVLLLVGPIKQWDHDEYLRMARKAKEQTVQDEIRAEEASAEGKVASNFFDRLAERVIDNITLRVTRVHIRYEDDFANPERPFAVGLTLTELTAVTTDALWHVQAHAGKGPVFKLLTAEKLSLYWNSQGDSGSWFGDSDFAQLETRRRFADLESWHLQPLLLEPTTLTLRLKMTKPADARSPPSFYARLEVSRLLVQLLEDQYRDIVVLLIYTGLFNRWCRYRKWLPKERPTRAAAEWWAYALRCVRFDLAQERVRRAHYLLRSRLKERLTMWIEYIGFWSRAQGAPWLEPLTASERLRLFEIEDTISVAEIIACRRRAEQKRAWQRARLNERSSGVSLRKKSQHSGNSAHAAAGSASAASSRGSSRCALASSADSRQFAGGVSTTLASLSVDAAGLHHLSAATAGASAAAAAGPQGSLAVEVVGARGLRGGSMSTYCVLYCDDEKLRTATVQRSATPFYNERFTLSLRDQESHLHVILFEENLFSPDAFLGHIFIPLRSLLLSAKATAVQNDEEESAPFSADASQPAAPAASPPPACRASCSSGDGQRASTHERVPGRVGGAPLQWYRLCAREADERERALGEVALRLRVTATRASSHLQRLREAIGIKGAQLALRRVGQSVSEVSSRSDRQDSASVGSGDCGSSCSEAPASAGDEKHTLLQSKTVQNLITELGYDPTEPAGSATAGTDARLPGSLNSWGRVGANLSAASAGQSGIDLRIRLVVTTGQLHLFTRQPHKLHLGLLRFAEWHSEVHLVHDGFESSSTIGTLDVQGRATRLRRLRGDDEPDGRNRVAPSGPHALGVCRSGEQPAPASTVPPRLGRAVGGTSTLRMSNPSGIAAYDDSMFGRREHRPRLTAERSEPNLRAAAVAESAGESAAGGSAAGDADERPKQPMVSLNLKWVPRAPKVGCERDRTMQFELGYSEWHGKAALAPLELMYHHGWVERVLRFFVEPWNASSDMEEQSLLDTMAQLMDSSLEVEIAHAYILIMNHFVGPNSPLVQLNLRDSQALLEHVVQSRFSANLIAKLDANYYNPRNRLFEPLLEPLFAHVQLLFKTPAALHQTAAFGSYTSAQVRLSPLRLNLTHAFLESLLNTYALASKADAQGGVGMQNGGGGAREKASDGAFVAAPFWIRNETGSNISYARGNLWRPAAGASGAFEASAVIQVPPEAQVALELEDEVEGDALLQDKSLSLRVYVEDVEYEVHDIIFDKVGVRLYSMRNISAKPKAEAQFGAHAFTSPRKLRGADTRVSIGVDESVPQRAATLVCEVRTQADGSNLLVARSPLRFRNSTAEPVEILLHSESTAAGAGVGPSTARRAVASGGSFRSQHTEVFGPVDPGDTWTAPLRVFDQFRHGFSVRPTGEDEAGSRCAWSERMSLSDSVTGCQLLSCGSQSDTSVRQAARTEGGVPSGAAQAATPSSSAAASSGRGFGGAAADVPRVCFCTVELEADAVWEEGVELPGTAAELPGDARRVTPARDLFRRGRPLVASLHAPLMVRNQLAVGMRFSLFPRVKKQFLPHLAFSRRLERGEHCLVHAVDPRRTVMLAVHLDGYQPSSMAAFKPAFRRGQEGGWRRLPKVQTLGRLVSTGKTSTVFMRDETHGQPLQVHVETWETAGACLNLLAYTTHWIVNKTLLPLEFRQKVGMLSRRVADGDGRPEDGDAVGDDAEGGNPECMGEVLLPGGDTAPRVSSPNDTFAYDAGEVTSGPLHVSYSKKYWHWPFHYAATLKVCGDSGWSAPFRLDQLEPATISLQSRHATGRYELGVVCKWAPEPFQRTQLVYVCPRYVLCNDTRHALQYIQHGAEGATARAVEPASKVVFHWSSAASKPALQVRVIRQNDCSVWSTPFTVDGQMQTAGEYFMLKVRRPASCNLDHLMVTMQHAHPVIFVVVSEGRAEHAPIMIDNQLEEPIRVCQRGCHYRDVVRAKRIMPYAWDFPLERRPTLVLTFGSDEADPRPGFRREIVIDGRPQQVELRLHASAAGPGQTIRICAEPVDCQRLIVRCEVVTSSTSLFLSSVSRLWYDRAQPLLLARRLRDEDPGNEWLDVELPCIPLSRRRLGAKELATLPVAQLGRGDAAPRAEPIDAPSEGTRLPTGRSGAQPPRPPPSSPQSAGQPATVGRAGVDADILRYGPNSGFSLRINTPIGRVLPVEAPSSSTDAAEEPPAAQRQSLYIVSPLDEPTRRKELMQLLEGHAAEAPVVSALEMWKNSSLKRRQLAFDLSCESIAVSIVDDAPKELLYLTLGGIAVSMSEGVNDEGRDRVADEADSHTKPFKYEQRLSIQLENLQVDNQRYNTAYPVLLWPIAAEVGQPVFALHLLRDISFSRPFAYLADVHIELQPLNVRLDEESVRAYLAFLDVFQPAESAQAVDAVVPYGRLRSIEEFEFTMLRPLPEAHGFKMFIERLYISRVQLRLSLKRSPSGFDHFSLNPLLTVFNTITTLLINIDDAPITFKALHRRAFFCFPDELTEATQRHYRSEIWRVALAVASSLDAIGKPYESLTDFANALRAAFVRPVRVARRSPSRFCPTLFWGVVELVKVCLLVPFNAMSKILQAWAKGLALLSLDPDFSQRRQQQIEFRPAAHLGQGVQQGVVRLLEASASAVGGFGLQPAAGWTRGGFWGACLGFSRASVGFVFKLIVGIFDLFAKVFEGVKNTFSIFQEKDRVRPPRAFRMDRVLRPYSEQEARATSLLVHCKMDSEPDENAEHEYYVDHFSISWMTRRGVPGPNKLLLITSQRVVLGDESRLRPEWEVRVERIARVEIKPGHLMLWTWEKIGLGTFTFSYNVVVERLVRCSNPTVLEALFSRLWSVAAQHDRAAMYSQRDRRKEAIARGYDSLLPGDACDVYIPNSNDSGVQFTPDQLHVGVV